MPPTGVAQIRAGVQEPSLAGAKSYVANLHDEYLQAQAAKKAARTPRHRAVHDHHAPRPRDDPDDGLRTGRRPRRPRRRDDHRHDRAMSGRALVGRRIRWLGVVLVLCFALVVVQLVEHPVPPGRAPWPTPRTTRASRPRVYDNQRGTITASDGTVLAKSVKINSQLEYLQLQREYPQGPLYAGITGYDSLYYGTSGIEYEYNQYLKTHAQSSAEPQPAALRQAAFGAGQRHAHRRPGAAGGRHRARWPPLRARTRTARSSCSIRRTGAVLAMVSNPTYRPQRSISSPTSPTEEAYDAAGIGSRTRRSSPA